MRPFMIHASVDVGTGTFDALVYTGGILELNGWEHPVVVDLAGLVKGNVLVANLDHNQSKRVGNVDEVLNDGRTLRMRGRLSAATEARREVVESAKRGYVWQTSIEVNPTKVDLVASGASVKANGQVFSGPIFVARRGVLKGFAFVSHGADDNTAVSIAARRREQPKHVTQQMPRYAVIRTSTPNITRY